MRLLLLLIFCSCQPAFAFGKTGHRITGNIAQQYLTPEAQQSITSILGKESLAQASTYMDDMRSHSSHFWQKQSKPWHYVTVPFGKKYQPSMAPKQGDAVTALKRFSQQLKDSKTSPKDKATALKIIIHLIADLHQPFHAGNGKDRGANEYKLKYFGRRSNLHQVWDYRLIEGQQLSFTEWTRFLQSEITPKQLKQWHSIRPEDWIAESIKYRDSAYPNKKDIAFDYEFEQIPVIKKRLSQAGVRIAFYLNNLFAQ